MHLRWPRWSGLFSLPAGAESLDRPEYPCFPRAHVLRTNHPAADEYPPTAADWYAFAWFDKAGKILFRIAGWWSGIGKVADQAFAFGVAAEKAWTQYRQEGAAQELAGTGRVRFDLAMGGALCLGRGVLELDIAGQVAQLG